MTVMELFRELTRLDGDAEVSVVGTAGEPIRIDRVDNHGGEADLVLPAVTAITGDEVQQP